jgi:hypothetical protein
MRALPDSASVTTKNFYHLVKIGATPFSKARKKPRHLMVPGLDEMGFQP